MHEKNKPLWGIFLCLVTKCFPWPVSMTTNVIQPSVCLNHWQFIGCGRLQQESNVLQTQNSPTIKHMWQIKRNTALNQLSVLVWLTDLLLQIKDTKVLWAYENWKAHMKILVMHFPGVSFDNKLTKPAELRLRNEHITYIIVLLIHVLTSAVF